MTDTESITARLLPPALRLCVAALWMLQVQPARAAESTSDAVVARVNGQPILLSQLREASIDLNVPEAALATGGLKGDAFRKAVTALVDEELLVQAARAEQIASDETEAARRVDELIRATIERMGGKTAFAELLRRTHASLEPLRRLAIEREKRQDLTTTIVGRRVKINGAEIEAFKERKRKAGESSEEYLLAHILIRCPKSEQGTDSGKRQHEKALQAAREAARGSAGFSDAARRLSDDTATREQGGLLGWLDPAWIEEPLRSRAMKLETGQVSEPVATDRGYHILTLVDRRTPRDLLFGERFGQERTKLLETLRAAANIELYPVIQ